MYGANSKMRDLGVQTGLPGERDMSDILRKRKRARTAPVPEGRCISRALACATGCDMFVADRFLLGVAFSGVVFFSSGTDAYSVQTQGAEPHTSVATDEWLRGQHLLAHSCLIEVNAFISGVI